MFFVYDNLYYYLKNITGTHSQEGNIMKKVVLLVCVFLFVCHITLTYAQAPQILNFQGRLNDSSGHPAADDNYSINF